MKINVNGTDYTLDVPGNTSLLDALRVNLHLTGSKYGCGEGACYPQRHCGCYGGAAI